jgi:hypothetical protein
MNRYQLIYFALRIAKNVQMTLKVQYTSVRILFAPILNSLLLYKRSKESNFLKRSEIHLISKSRIGFSLYCTEY